MREFFGELRFVALVLLTFAAAGGWVIVPFRRRLPYGALAAPLAGMLVALLGTAVLYGIAGLSVAYAAASSAGVCLCLTAAAIMVCRPRPEPRQIAWQIALAISLLVVLVLTVDAATLRARGPAVLYTHGTDHLGYAQLSDWIVSHPISVAPHATRQDPRPAWAEFVFKSDPRFGTFYFLAIIQSLRGQSGTFCFDVACVIALAAGILAVAGVFARSWWTLLLLAGGLVVSHWFDYSRCGFLGKIIGYPSALLVLGLFFSLRDVRSHAIVCLLAIVAGAASIVYPGVAIAMLIAAVCVPYLLRCGGNERSDRAAVALLLVVVCGLASGLAARPVSILSPRTGGPGWLFLVPRILDLENQVTGLSRLGPVMLWSAVTAAAVVNGSLIVVAWRTRDAAALGLLAGPLLLLAFVAPAGGWVPVLQLIGILYPFALCGAVHLLDELPRPVPLRGRVVALALTIVMVALRVPRYIGAVRRYAGSEVYSGWVYSKHDADRLERKMRGKTVLVDIDNANEAIFVVAELARRGVTFQWTPTTWRTLFSYTELRLPAYDRPAQLELVGAEASDHGLPVVLRTANFKLLDLSSHRTELPGSTELPHESVGNPRCTCCAAAPLRGPTSFISTARALQ